MSSAIPQWLETVGEKRKLRDDAISRFLDGQSVSIEVPDYAALSRVACSRILANTTKCIWQ
jgi:hypothetical protein